MASPILLIIAPANNRKNLIKKGDLENKVKDYNQKSNISICGKS